MITIYLFFQPDKRSFVISIIVENKIMSVLSACAEEWKNGTYVSSEATILHLVQCLWKHVMVVKQYADKLCKYLICSIPLHISLNLNPV